MRERERKREGGRESERQSRTTEHLSGKRKKICFCTLSEYSLSWVFAGPLVLFDSSYRNKALSRKEPQFSDISSSLMMGQEKSGFAHTHLLTESENDKMSYLYWSQNYIYALSTAIQSQSVILPFLGSQTLNFLIIFQLCVYFTVTNR